MMAGQAKQYCLSAPGCSGRGVRMALLDPTTRQGIREETLRGMPSEATMAEWTIKESVVGVVASVVQITEKGGYKSAKALVGDDVAWKKVSAEHLHDHLTDYFNAKDLDALTKFFRDLHDVKPKEIEDMMGEALDVTVD